MRDPDQAFAHRVSWVGFVPVAIVVGMQMKHVNGGFITNYGADIAGPVWAYGMTRETKTALFRRRVPWISPAAAIALFVFLVGTIWEVCEAFDFSGTPLAITRGRFDPLDLVAYAGSLAACYAVDRAFERRRAARVVDPAR
jgi:hypothetical protein